MRRSRFRIQNFIVSAVAIVIGITVLFIGINAFNKTIGETAQELFPGAEVKTLNLAPPSFLPDSIKNLINRIEGKVDGWANGKDIVNMAQNLEHESVWPLLGDVLQDAKETAPDIISEVKDLVPEIDSALLGSTAACIPATNRVQAEVTYVVDGDTIKISLFGEEYTVRYIGIDTPETVKPDYPVEFMGPEASERNKELVSVGETITIIQDISETDQYGRILAYVLDEEGVFVNYVLVREGLAGTLTIPPDISCANVFTLAQAEAQAEGLGLWVKGY